VKKQGPSPTSTTRQTPGASQASNTQQTQQYSSDDEECFVMDYKPPPNKNTGFRYNPPFQQGNLNNEYC